MQRFEQAFAGMPFELRRFGLTMALKFEHEQGGVLAAKQLIDAGVFAVYAEHDHSVTQFKPPLIVTESDVDEICGDGPRRAGVIGGDLDLADATCASSTIWSSGRLRPATNRVCRCSATGRSRWCWAGPPTMPGSRASGCRRSLRCSGSPPTARRSTTTSRRSPPPGCAWSRRRCAAWSVATARSPGYVVQPVLPAAELAPRVLRGADPGAAHPLIEAVVAAAAQTVTPKVGLDAQLANWTWNDGGLTYIDVSTPMLWSADDRPRLDLDLLAHGLPGDPSLAAAAVRRRRGSSTATATCARCISI